MWWRHRVRVRVDSCIVGFVGEKKEKVGALLAAIVGKGERVGRLTCWGSGERGRWSPQPRAPEASGLERLLG
jgi:hypothetical protein